MEVPNDQHAVKPSSCIIEWTIENVSTLSEEKHFSPIFKIGPHKWRLLAFRRGSNVDDYLSLYVVAEECTNSRYAKFSLAVVGQTNNTFKKEASLFWFTKDANDWGFYDFIKFKELIDPSNGYIVDDACTVVLELYLNSAQDSVEELVPMELIESVEERDSDTNCTLQASTSVCPDNNSAFICAFCQTFEASEVSGPMLHIGNGKEVEEGEASGPNLIHVHQKCIEWAPQLYYDGETAMNLELELARGSKLKCSYCGLKGAALGCFISSCKNTYHVPCAFGSSGCRIDDEVRRVLCPSHSGMKFTHEKTKKGNKLEKDNSSSVERKQRGTERGEQKEGEKTVESEREAIQHGEKVTEKWQGTVRRYNKRLRAAADREKGAENGEILDGNKVVENDKENMKIVEEITSSENSDSEDGDFEKKPAKRAKMTLQNKVSKANEDQGQSQQNEVAEQEVRKEVKTEARGDGVGKVDQEQLLILQEKYDDLRMSKKTGWDKKEIKKLNGETVQNEVEELLNEFYFKAYQVEKSEKGNKLAKDNSSTVQRKSWQANVWAASASATSKLVICGSSLSAEEKNLLANFAKISGVTVSEHWKPNVTHVIASTDRRGACKRTLRFLKAILDGKWVLKIDWIKACTEAMDLVYEEPYEIGLDNRGCRDGPRNGRLRVSEGAPKLFSGLQFYFSGDFAPLYRESLEELVLAAGALVLTKNSLVSLSSDEGERSSKTLVVYSLDLPPNLKSEEASSMVITERRREAEALAEQSRCFAIGHKWILQSVAALKLEPVS